MATEMYMTLAPDHTQRRPLAINQRLTLLTVVERRGNAPHQSWKRRVRLRQWWSAKPPPGVGVVDGIFVRNKALNTAAAGLRFRDTNRCCTESWIFVHHAV